MTNKEKDLEIKQWERYITKMASTYTVNDYIKEELIQEGRIAISQAIDNYDENKGTKKTYIIQYIKGYFKKYLTNNTRTIRIPTNVINKNSSTYCPEREKMALNQRTLDINGTFGGEQTLLETILIPIEDTEEDDEVITRRSVLRKQLSQLNDYQREIIKLRYEDELTFEQIGNKLDKTPQGIQFQHKNIISKLKLALQNI